MRVLTGRESAEIIRRNEEKNQDGGKINGENHKNNLNKLKHTHTKKKTVK